MGGSVNQPRESVEDARADLHPVIVEHQIIGTQTGKQGAGQVVPEDSVLCAKCGWMRCSDYTWHLSDALAASRAVPSDRCTCIPTGSLDFEGPDRDCAVHGEPAVPSDPTATTEDTARAAEVIDDACYGGADNPQDIAKALADAGLLNKKGD